MNKLSTFRIKDSHFWIILLVDSLLILISFFGSFFLRFDPIFPTEYRYVLPQLPIYSVIVKLLIFNLFGLYKGMYRYTGLVDVINIAKASTTTSIIIVAGLGFIKGFQGIPRSLFILDYILTTLLIIGYRVSIRVFFTHYFLPPRLNHTNGEKNSKGKNKKLILIGAGDAGEQILYELHNRPYYQYKVVGFLDDDLQKHNRTIHGVPVLGFTNTLSNLNISYDEILICIPAATNEEMRRIVTLCRATGKRYRTVPGIIELINGNVTAQTIRKVSLIDLIGREEINLDRNSIEGYIKDKRVLITGAGGSIGSELVRHCLTYKPDLLILLDNSENNLFQIESECHENGETHSISAVLANIKNKEYMNNVFASYKPEVVFHAAAYKHVPMQELHPYQAVLTNVQGTINLVELSVYHRVEKFVLVSTDKAVNPVNVMGATKRLAEMMIQSADGLNGTKFMAVRFGNVIGSSGSAVPLFQEQIKKGGPVTLTHPDMKRYFMSIPEAAQLILQAGALGKGNEIFVLEMGDPIKIKDLTYDLIRLSGFEPGVDISIKYIGLRPGEKMFEELVKDDEQIIMTKHDKIMILRSDNYLAWEELKFLICDIVEIAKSFDANAIKNKLKEIIPEYIPYKSENIRQYKSENIRQ